ncbi:uncharacterized membrane protein YgdD (TMEM256/DUF423 family) [Paenibacillus shirakamiensis]|uniref:Uncharacterized membrane protein YgdD (TMEM256/DUF423 family) n=1 Tax=Paenibacillus shirakamiensis TaxID=1265935 RepID=A0ABS4JLL1_9BACL|nr:DUF423 domain-containing protein [Paenibacillus shirakamiensis]MBP2002595.1 uncharacterized membrane protein YgdD (TMEM256/DUF423 family) [Paenibacillus shirakamiensis]
MQRKSVGIGAIVMLLGVAIGAFGAHALKSVLGDHAATYETGVLYHMIHGLGIILIGIAAHAWGESKRLLWASRLLLIGTILFSGSLYVLSITGITLLGAITPFGGVAFILGWLLFALEAFKK